MTVKLIGTKATRDGTGAKLNLTSEGLNIHEQAKGGMSYMSAHDLRIHFDLGTRKTIESLEITWLSGTVDKLTNVPINQVITVKEGVGIVSGNFPRIPS
ncbi:MAG: ASPIC/UnbV domain-containing protein [Acidobacteria bacterium]|nr:ASPIC/UnbV domain-containing protein [Acidobacteriota bacterium]